MKNGKCGIMSDLYSAINVSALSILRMFKSMTSPSRGGSNARPEEVEDVDDSAKDETSGRDNWV